MLRRNLLAKSVLISMPHAIGHDDKLEYVAMEIPVRHFILEVQHKKETTAVALLLTPLCATIKHLEGGEATFLAVSLMSRMMYFSSIRRRARCGP